MSGFESDRLVAVVQRLCRQSKRPVSSKDLLCFFRAHPDERPLLYQRLGQNLFKLAGRADARIFRVGIIGNLAFYAPDQSAIWADCFERHRAAILINEQLCLRMPEHVQCLLNTRFDSLVRNSLAGFIAEWFPLWRMLGRAGSADFGSLLQLAERDAALEFIRTSPQCSTRAEAAQVLRSEYGTRTPLCEPEALNVGRHLVNLRPSPLLPVPPESFWLERVRVYCGARWPTSEQESTFSRGLSLAMAYGDAPIHP